MVCSIKKPEELTDQEIEIIIRLWENDAWAGMTPDAFKNLFKDSEFHLLLDIDGKIASVLRLNFDFTLEISGNLYPFVEMGGFASDEKGKGYGTQLLQFSLENSTERKLQIIGFCFSDLRPFYEKCHIEILYDQAKNILEREGNHWIASEDDDILIIHLSEENKTLFKKLDSQNPAYLIP
ncbi:hypothetical protein CEY12_21840 [Chryseobacterium sp. T16E-39]|uniref:GNAT family N-acetyltransferase n=1 Tax=Chryseobacterium sp. T16E-39 TaxID=2015076 RepID=UPI000B5B4458|nr:GNAT family N-acetyltransferase [Chryseobacterium sp. T16E-39]ASK32564.1 hypothetical protein CEY12_21840 [Chryseobacterium sp. T16E-39]